MAFPDTVRRSYQTDIEAIRSAGLFKEERFIHSPQSASIEVEFPVGSPPRTCINICANNYLGLSSHPEVIAAAHSGLDARGYGMSSVRFICGTQDIHRELEKRLTGFLGTEDTLLFPSCMDANAGFFEACLNDQDVMIADRLVHASIVDGMRLCKAMQDTFKHSDMGHLEEKLQEHQDKRMRMVITDGVFSMDGDTAKLDAIVALAENRGRNKYKVGKGVYVFWFVADDEQTTGNVQFQCYLVRDLLLKGVLQRWAYISYFSVCLPGQEEATFERMKKLIAASVPEFQLPLRSAKAAPPG